MEKEETVIQVVLDTNLIVAALRSTNGASFQILRGMGKQGWRNNISTALLFEYEEQAKKLATEIDLPGEEVEEFLNHIHASSACWVKYWNWRPISQDPDDDLVAEIAINSKADYIVTYNTRDFAKLWEWGIKVIKPGEFLKLIK